MSYEVEASDAVREAILAWSISDASKAIITAELDEFLSTEEDIGVQVVAPVRVVVARITCDIPEGTYDVIAWIDGTPDIGTRRIWEIALRKTS